MTTPEAQRRREIETIWLLRFTVLLLLIFAGYQILVVNPQNDDTQDSIRATQAEQVQATMEIHALADKNRRQVGKINHSLCALRSDLKRRVAQTQKFLDHPNDFPAFSDPKTVALIQAQLEGQQRTIDALSILSCEAFK